MKEGKEFLAALFLIIAQFIAGPEISAQPGMAATLPMDGYVILSNNDTLYGQVKWSLKYVENNPVEIKFIADNGNSRLFKAGDIKGFGNIISTWAADESQIADQKYQDYLCVPSFKKNIMVFMHRLLAGRLTVLQNRSSGILSSSAVSEISKIDGIMFSWSPGVGLSIGPSYKTDYRIIESKTRFTSYFVRKADGPMIKIEKENYEENFNALYGDCPAIQEELNKNPDLRKFRNFMILAEVYNRICKSE